MNLHFFVVLAIALLTVLASIQISLPQIYALPVFGMVAVVLSPLAVHKIPSAPNAALALIVLGIMGSIPLRSLLQLDYLPMGVLVILAYSAVLWVTGFGWRRTWR